MDAKKEVVPSEQCPSQSSADTMIDGELRMNISSDTQDWDK